MSDKTSQAASALAKKRWRGMTAEERSEHNTKIAQLPRTAKRCFCGQESMWVAANRYFDCCRRAGVITLNLEKKRELHDGRRRATEQVAGAGEQGRPRLS